MLHDLGVRLILRCDLYSGKYGTYKLLYIIIILLLFIVIIIILLYNIYIYIYIIIYMYIDSAKQLKLPLTVHNII